MSKVLLLLISLQFSLFGYSKVILYFDVNKTLIAEDSAGGQSQKAVINEISSSDKEKNEIEAKIGKNLVFPSFYKLIAYLNCRKIDYTIVLRTFGTDLSRLVSEINHHIYPSRFCLFGRYKEGVLTIDDKQVTDKEAYCLIKKHHFIAIRDDYDEWLAHDYNREHGKKFLIDTSDPETLSLFFDDNIRLSSERSIVTPIDVRTGQVITSDKGLVRVRTVKAILNDSYYIEIVDKILK